MLYVLSGIGYVLSGSVTTKDSIHHTSGATLYYNFNATLKVDCGLGDQERQGPGRAPAGPAACVSAGIYGEVPALQRWSS